MRLTAEKLSSEISVNTVFAGWSLVNREAFHVVDFKAQVRLEQDANPVGHARGGTFLAVEDAQPRAANDPGGGAGMRLAVPKPSARLSNSIFSRPLENTGDPPYDIQYATCISKELSCKSQNGETASLFGCLRP